MRNDICVSVLLARLGYAVRNARVRPASHRTRGKRCGRGCTCEQVLSVVSEKPLHGRLRGGVRDWRMCKRPPSFVDPAFSHLRQDSPSLFGGVAASFFGLHCSPCPKASTPRRIVAVGLVQRVTCAPEGFNAVVRVP